ncbi:MAG: hypothetical protein A3F90_14450 [Deltaproteobacteria bacterium RIFCSPLOWO2_12_FULL_60_19]|nr:MAG: hypothetical protein A3F90_14450 [Deltaproteobacteria bacterium RIFCSPLOWO2_12_FULL_60_19]
MGLTTNQKRLLEAAKAVARELGEHGRCLSGLIGELEVCTRLDLGWRPSDGFDAVTKKGRRIQIKTRKSWSTEKVNPLGRLGRFGRKAGYLFDEGLLVELDSSFEATGIWQLGKDQIRALEEKMPGKGLHVGTFMRRGNRVL